MNGVEPGDNLLTKTFTSTSINRDVAEGFTNKTDLNKAFMLKITVPQNTFPFPYISNCKTPENCEAEVLLPFGCTLEYEKEEEEEYGIHNICYKLVGIDETSKIDISNIHKIIFSELEEYSRQKHPSGFKEKSIITKKSQIVNKPTTRTSTISSTRKSVRLKELQEINDLKKRISSQSKNKKTKRGGSKKKKRKKTRRRRKY
jgi:hypothetical protein